MRKREEEAKLRFADPGAGACRSRQGMAKELVLVMLLLVWLPRSNPRCRTPYSFLEASCIVKGAMHEIPRLFTPICTLGTCFAHLGRAITKEQLPDMFTCTIVLSFSL